MLESVQKDHFKYELAFIDDKYPPVVARGSGGVQRPLLVLVGRPCFAGTLVGVVAPSCAATSS